MSAASIGGSSAPAGASLLGTSSRETRSRFSEISSEDFVNLIVTELTNQDPTEPQDTQALLDQIGAIRSIESDTQLIDKLGSLVEQSSFASAANLIGAVVRGVSDAGNVVTDQVVSVSQTRDGAVLNLFGGRRVRLDQLLEVAAPVPPAEEPSSGATPPPATSDPNKPGEGTPEPKPDEAAA